MYCCCPKISKYIKLCLALAVLSGVLSCAPKKSTVGTNIVFAKNPKLLFLNYTVSKTASGEKRVDFLSKTIAKGTLKNKGSKYVKTPLAGDLKCAQLSKNRSELIVTYIKNPLNKVIEVLNDSLSFEKRIISQNKANLPLRLQLHPDTKFVVISELIDSLNSTKQLIKTKLE